MSMESFSSGGVGEEEEESMMSGTCFFLTVEGKCHLIECCDKEEDRKRKGSELFIVIGEQNVPDSLEFSSLTR